MSRKPGLFDFAIAPPELHKKKPVTVDRLTETPRMKLERLEDEKKDKLKTGNGWD